MFKLQKIWRLVTLAALLAGALNLSLIPATPARAAGTISLTGFSAYTQDFNTLALSGTSSSVPTGWDFAESGTLADTFYKAGTGSSVAGDTYSFGALSAAERAFGGLHDINLVPTFGASFTNNTGGALAALQINYTGEQWRLGTTGRGPDRIDFQLSTDATSLTTGTWTDYNSLDFAGPITVGTVGALDGNDSANRTAVSYTITGLNITNGSSFWIRWQDFNVSSLDDGLAVDDFSLTPTSSAPTVAITLADVNPTNAASVNFTATFSETVSGVDTGDFDLTASGGLSGATVTNVSSITSSIYTVTVNTGTGDGTLRLDVKGSATIQDALGNPFVGPYQGGETYTIEKTAPTVTISSLAPNPTNVSPIPVTVQFSEAVINFVAGDITAGNGSISNFVAVDDDTYTFNLIPSGQGLVTANIAANAASDAAGNGNTAATQFSRTYDSIVPTVTMSSAALDPTHTSPIPITVQFSEAVINFTVGDVSPVIGSVSNFVAVDGDTYTFDLIPSGQGLVTANIAAGAATDAAGNGNTAATQFSRTYDSVVPTVTISSLAPNPTKISPIPVTVQFSEAVSNFVEGDITIGNGSVSNFVAVDGDTYTFNLIPSGQGLVTANIAGGAATDAAGNGNTVAAQFSRTYDTVAPTVTISSLTSNPTNVSPIPVTVQFSETVSNFVEGDIVLTNGSVSSFVAVDGDTYTFDLTPVTQGLVTVDIAGNTASDAAGNSNTAATQFSRSYDSVIPTVAMSSVASTSTNVSPIPVTVQFSEAVINFIAGDIVPDNATVSSFVVVDGDTYTFNLLPSGQGLVTANIAAGAASDAAGNGNTVAAQFSRTYDTIDPTVTMSSVALDPTHTSLIPVTVQFSEAVSNFVIGDIVPTNGIVSTFVAVDGDTYTFDLAPITQGPVTANIDGGAVTDAADNGNTAAAQFSRTYDSVVPTVTMSSVTLDPTNVSSIPVTVQFSEVVIGFTAGDIATVNGSVDNFVAVDGDTYTFDLTPIAQGLVTADIAADLASDTAGNGNAAAAQFSRTYDTVILTVTMNSVSPDPTNVSPIPVTVQFSEAVTNFIEGDITAGNGSVSNFAAVDGDTYTFDLTPSGQGTVTADIAADAASDGAGNGNAAAAQFSRTYDTVAPTVTMTSLASDPVHDASPISVTVQFSETVTDFTVDDITSVNGSVSNFVAVDGDTYTFDLTPGGLGLVTADIAEAVASDAAGNDNAAATQFQRTFSLYSLFLPLIQR
jgi:predicted lipase